MTERRLVSGRSVRLLAAVPLLLACMGNTSRSFPKLVRTKPPSHTLQFASYCYHHGSEPVTVPELVSWFEYRNAGTHPITIGPTDVSCGCMHPDFSRRELEPGQTGMMKVRIPLADQGSGPQEYLLTVHYRDPEPRRETVRVRAVIPQPDIHIQPAVMIVSQKTAASVAHDFVITDTRPTPVRIRQIRATVPWVRGQVVSTDERTGRTRIRIEVDGNIPAGRHRVLVTAETDDPEHPVLVLRLLIDGPSRTLPAAATPSELRLSAQDRSARRLRFRLPASWDVSHVTCFPPELHAVWDPDAVTSDGTFQELVLTVSLDGAPARGVQEGVIALHTADGSNLATCRVEITETDAGGPAGR